MYGLFLPQAISELSYQDHDYSVSGAGEDLQWILEEIKNSLGKSSGKIVGVMRTTLSTLILDSLQAKETSAFVQAVPLLTEVVSSLTSHLRASIFF